MKRKLKIGCGVPLGLGALGIVGVVLIGGCLPSAPEPVTPTPQVPPPSPTQEELPHKIIEDLAYIKTIGKVYSDDADPEYEGSEFLILWYDSKSEPIYFRNIAVLVSVEVFTTRFTGEGFEQEIIRSVYKAETEIDSSGSWIRIPFEDIRANPNIDKQIGIGKVTVHTPQQGDFSAEIETVMLYESD